MTAEVRSHRRLLLALVLVLAVVAGLGYFAYSALYPHGVSDGVVASVRGDGIRIVETVQDTNPTDEWTNTYLLIEVNGADPVARLGSTLAANGWTVRRDGAAQGLVLAADRTEAGLTVVTFADFQTDGRDVPKALSAFERKSAGTQDLFVAILMPY